MWLTLVKKSLSLQEKDLDTLFWDLDINDKWGDYDLKIELLSRIKDERTFRQVMTSLQQSILDSVYQKQLIDEALKSKYEDENSIHYINALEESFEEYKSKTEFSFDTQAGMMQVEKMIQDIVDKWEEPEMLTDVSRVDQLIWICVNNNNNN